MKLEYYPVTQLQQDIKAIVSKHLDPTQYKVFFFGSRVAQRSHERSDIDIGLADVLHQEKNEYILYLATWLPDE